MLHVALGVAAGMAHAKETGQCCGGAIDIPKVRIFQKYLIFTPMNDTTVRLFMYPQVVKKGDWRCYLCGGPTTLRSNNSMALSCQGDVNGRMKGSGQQFIVVTFKLIHGKDSKP